jgi:cytochrome c5
MRRLAMPLVPILGLTLAAAPRAAADELAARVRTILETNCHRCHGKDGTNEGGFDYILDVKKMIARRKIVPNDPGRSRLLQRASSKKTTEVMPPDGEKPRPSPDDLDTLQRWIQAGAAEFAAPDVVARPFVTDKDVYKAMYDYLFEQHPESARYQRFFTLTNLYNNPRVSDAELALYRAGLSKLLNSLSWRRAVVLPRMIDKQGVVLAIDLRDLDWDLNDQWQQLIGHTADEPREAFYAGYPYALTHERYPEDEALNRLADQVYKLARTRVPAVRADWFLATASVPPLYHDLLNLPTQAGVLETQLKVNVGRNFRRDRAARAGFSSSATRRPTGPTGRATTSAPVTAAATCSSSLWAR